MTALELSLQEACRTCVNSRRWLDYVNIFNYNYRQLRMAKEGVSLGGLGLLAKHRKRERLNYLLEILRTFKTLVSWLLQ